MGWWQGRRGAGKTRPVPTLYDLAYAAAVALGAPVWGLRAKGRRKVLAAFRERFGDVPVRDGIGPSVMIHAVSVGEVNATAALVAELRAARPGLEITVSTTTATGWERARALYGDSPGVAVIRYPLDFSAAVRRTLDRRRPAVVVLMELEVWPNFVRECAQRGIRVVLANGRITAKSFRGYRLAGPVVRRMFRRLSLVAAQDETYAARFVRLGAAAERVKVFGTMKFDTAAVGDSVGGERELAAAVGLDGGPVWVCGSTGPGEEAVVLSVYRRLLEVFPALRLVIVPRKPERFDAVADEILAAGFGVVRRSGKANVQRPASHVQLPTLILGDTMGELRAFYALADVVFVGRTLVDLGPSQHGSDMIEPAALGKAVVVGPFTGNFAEPMNRFRSASAAVEVADEEGLRSAISRLLASPDERGALGERAQRVVREQRGSTDRHARAVLGLLPD